MTIFWILAAGLLGLAILFVVLPLLRRAPTAASPDQDALNLQVFRQRLAELDGDLTAGFLDQSQYDAAYRDLERELLYDLDGGRKTNGVAPKAVTGRSPWLAAGLALALPIAVVAAYLKLGDNDIIPRIETAANGTPAPAAGHAGGQMPPLDVLVQKLAERLEQNPDNLDGWLMLGRTYFAIKQPDKALDAMEYAYKLAPDQASVVVAYAEAVAANQGNSLAGKPAELIHTALKLEPRNPGARWLGGMLAYQQENFVDAITTWQSLLDEMDPAGQEATDMRKMIAEARGRAGMGSADAAPAALAPGQTTPPAASGTSQPPAGPGGTTVAESGAKIQVSVSLDPAVGTKAAPTDAVFVYARAASGPPMPLAVKRMKVSDLPASVTLDDSMAMMPAMRLSAFPQVLVGARVSQSGQAMPQSGDLEGQVGPMDSAGTHEVAVTIDQIRP